MIALTVPALWPHQVFEDHPLRQSRAGRFRPLIEAIEGRMLLSTFTVANLNDSGAGSLRQALLDANARPVRRLSSSTSRWPVRSR